jgi:hypothetical protein
MPDSTLTFFCSPALYLIQWSSFKGREWRRWSLSQRNFHQLRNVGSWTVDTCESCPQLDVTLWCYIPEMQNKWFFLFLSWSMIASIPCHQWEHSAEPRVKTSIPFSHDMIDIHFVFCFPLGTCGNHKSYSWWGGRAGALSTYPRCHLAFNM